MIGAAADVLASSVAQVAPEVLEILGEPVESHIINVLPLPEITPLVSPTEDTWVPTAELLE